MAPCTFPGCQRTDARRCLGESPLDRVPGRAMPVTPDARCSTPSGPHAGTTRAAPGGRARAPSVVTALDGASRERTRRRRLPERGGYQQLDAQIKELGGGA